MPARFRDVVRAFAQFDVVLEHGAKHHKLRLEGCRPFTIPAHNGLKEEVPDQYVKAACKNFGIDYARLKRLL